MKYSKKHLSELVSDLRSLIDQNFRFQLTSLENSAAVNKFISGHMKTDKGNNRYPAYYSTVLYSFHREYSEVKMRENTLFCYLVDNVLYTTYKKSASYYKGDVTLKHYKDDPTIEEKVLYNKGNVTNGYYYNSGKPYFVKYTEQDE
jgi:hypothetical protein